MAYVPVPKDLTRVKSKFLFNLTKRQVVCFGLGALVGLPVFFLTKGAIGVSMAAALMIVIMLPFFLFAMFERNGQPLEVLLKHYIQARFIRPRTRVFETENFYATLEQNTRNRRLQELMTRSQQQNAKKVPRTAQATIPYQRMWPDGICRVTDNYYTKTIQFQDINYQLAQNDDKTSIFEGWCDFLNYFDASIHLQFSFLNLTASAESFEQSIIIPDKDDGFNDVRHEYAEMLQNQLAKGNNGLTKTKFITYGIEAENFKTAKPRLERIEIDLLNNFKRLGVAASPLDGRERLKLMHDMFHMDTQAPFRRHRSSSTGNGWPRPGCPQRTLSRRRASTSGRRIPSVWAASRAKSASSLSWPPT